MKNASRVESIQEAGDQIRTDLIKDIQRRKQEAIERIKALILMRPQRLAAQRAASGIEGQMDKVMTFQTEVAKIDLELNRLNHLVLPGFDREHDSIVMGGHPKLAAQEHLRCVTTAIAASNALEASRAEFSAACTRELIEIAKRNVEAHKTLLITPSDVAVLISQLPIN